MLCLRMKGRGEGEGSREGRGEFELTRRGGNERTKAVGGKAPGSKAREGYSRTRDY